MTTPSETSVALLLGDPDGSGGAARVEELRLSSPATADAVVQQLARVNITPTDVRANVQLVLPPAVPAADAAVIVATLDGFMGRFVPVRAADGEVEPVEAPAETPRRPDVVEDEITIDADTDLSEPQVHFARRARVNLDGLGTAAALSLVLSVAAARKRPLHERLPDLAVADGQDPVQLEDARRTGLAYRGDLRKPAASSTAEERDPSPRLQRLQRAAEAPIADVLRRLGATTDASGEKWHCSRPDRHNNGDRNPSLKIVDGRTRCFRCDPEWVDSLRLVVDTLQVTPDEAAVWIESGEARAPLH